SLKFQKLLPFASSNQVRVECLLAATENLGAVELSAAINHAQTGKLLWQGPLGHTNLAADKAVLLSQTISDLKPDLWSPISPVLYNLKFIARKDNNLLAEQTVCFGFRSFESRQGQFFLNGRPLFLRGLAINPPG